MSIFFTVLDGRNPASPAAERMRQHRLKMSQEKKEDPEYGQMLKRMWSGDLTKEDRMRINTRVLGSSGLELPPDFEGK